MDFMPLSLNSSSLTCSICTLAAIIRHLVAMECQKLHMVDTPIFSRLSQCIFDSDLCIYHLLDIVLEKVYLSSIRGYPQPNYFALSDMNWGLFSLNPSLSGGRGAGGRKVFLDDFSQRLDFRAKFWLTNL